MPRPKKMRFVGQQPTATFFKPTGISMRTLEHVILEMDELEAMRLADFQGLSQEEAADQMQVSRATFGRIVARGRQKCADALLHGKAIQIEGGMVCFGSENGPPFGKGHCGRRGRGRCHG